MRDGVLDDALVIVTSDHGHSMWERRGYIGKRGYPSDPESYDLPLLVRHPQKRRRRAPRATPSSSTTTSPRRCSTRPGSRRRRRSTASRSGRPRSTAARAKRDHVTIGWGSAMTVIDEAGGSTRRSTAAARFCTTRRDRRPTRRTSREKHPEVVKRMFEPRQAPTPAASFPEYLLKQAEGAGDAPGCSPFAAIRERGASEGAA